MKDDENPNVISMGDWVVQHKNGCRSPFPAYGECAHKQLVMNDNGQYVDCKDCGRQLSAYWVLQHILRVFDHHRRQLKRQWEQLNEEKARTLHFRAAKEIEIAWRSKSMVPACPHCRRGILPEDRLGTHMIHKEIDKRQRAVKKND